ncbi:MAG: ATP-binding protein [Gemmatimonadaceae bacterium]
MSQPAFPNTLLVEASRAISRYAAHQWVLEAMAMRLPLSQVLTRLALSIEDAAPGSSCAIMLIDESGGYVHSGAAPNLPPQFTNVIDPLAIGPAAGSCGTAVWRRERVVVSDIANDPLWADYRDLALVHELRACWSTPIIAADGAVLGSFAVYYRTVRAPQASEISLVDDAVSLACVAIGQQRAESSLRVSEAHYRAVVETAPSPIVGLDADELVTEWNRAAEQMFGRTRDSVLFRHFSETCLEIDARATFERCFSQSHTQRMLSSCETEILRPDGTRRWVMWSMSHRIANDKGIDGFLAIAQDITGRIEAETALRRSEQQLRHSQKMEAVGRLAGGIAHDFNNLLTVIHGNTSLALQDSAKGSPQQMALEEVRDASTRATSLTRQLLTFSRREAVELQLLDLNAIVEDLRRMLGRLIGAHIQLETELSPMSVVVKADRTNLEQLLINLVVNARDAMQDGGMLNIVTSRVTLDNEAAAALELAAGPYVSLSVSDTGFGMDEETRARAFEPFFTTKPSGEGTGLGLATVYAIAARHGGAVNIDSHPGIGTTVTFWLPSVAGIAATAAKSGEHPAQNGTGTVFLVEDEEAVRHLARRVLIAHGFRVLEASNGEEALHLWKEFGQTVDVVVTDVVMPKMGGPALVDFLRSDRPDLAVVFCSGYSDNPLVSMREDNVHTAFLAKPFTLNALVERVSRLCALSNRSGSGAYPSLRIEP